MTKLRNDKTRSLLLWLVHYNKYAVQLLSKTTIMSLPDSHMENSGELGIRKWENRSHKISKMSSTTTNYHKERSDGGGRE